MTFHAIGAARGLIREKRHGVWIGVSERRETKRKAQYTRVVLTVAIYADVLDQVGWRIGMDIMLEVGADHDVGMLRVRPADAAERGIRLRKIGGYAGYFERPMTAFPLPRISGRPSCAAKKIAVDNGVLTLLLPGEFARDLRAAQELAIKTTREVQHAKG